MFLTLYIAHTELFFVIDDFFLRFEATYWKFLKQSGRCLRIRPSELSISEIIFIVVWYKGEFKHEVRQFEKSYDNQQAEQISLMV